MAILIDLCVAFDVAGKFSQGEKIDALAEGYSLDRKAIAAPIIAEWDAKKKASYEKRDKKLEVERRKVEGKKRKKKAADEGAAIVHALHTGEGEVEVGKDQTVKLKKGRKPKKA